MGANYSIILLFYTGLAASEVSGPGSPGQLGGLHQLGGADRSGGRAGSPGGTADRYGGRGGSPGAEELALPQRPQPARSPFEWMKRPALTPRPCKEGSGLLADGK